MRDSRSNSQALGPSESNSNSRSHFPVMIQHDLDMIVMQSQHKNKKKFIKAVQDAAVSNGAVSGLYTSQNFQEKNIN